MSSMPKLLNQEVTVQNLGVSQAPLWFLASGKMGKWALCSLKNVGFEGCSWSFFHLESHPLSTLHVLLPPSAQSHSGRRANRGLLA